MKNSKLSLPVVYIIIAVLFYQALNVNVMPEKLQKFDGLTFLLIIIAGLNTLILIAFLKIKPSYDEQKDVRDSSNILRTITIEIDLI